MRKTGNKLNENTAVKGAKLCFRALTAVLLCNIRFSQRYSLVRGLLSRYYTELRKSETKKNIGVAIQHRWIVKKDYQIRIGFFDKGLYTAGKIAQINGIHIII